MTSVFETAFLAVETFPHLHAQVEESLAAQARRIAERTAVFVPRPSLVKAVDEAIHAGDHGVVVLEGAAGSGTTTLLCHLAATRPYAIWLPDDDAGEGLTALCAQIVALANLAVKLVPPAAERDTTTLEQLLFEAGATRAPDEPLVVLIDWTWDATLRPNAPPLPAVIPAGVVVVLACVLGTELPVLVNARVAMPSKGAHLERRIAQAAELFGSTPEHATAVAAHSSGSFLYARIASGLLISNVLPAEELPYDIDELHGAWWSRLRDVEQHVFRLLAVAGELLDLPFLAELAGVSLEVIQRLLTRSRALLEAREGQVQIYHSRTRAFIAAQSDDELVDAHATFVALARRRTDGHFERLRAPVDEYLLRHLARHTVLSDSITYTQTAPALATRRWAIARERATGTLRNAAGDLAWLLRAASANGGVLELARCAMLGGVLTSLGRALSAAAPAAVLSDAIENGLPRDQALKRVRAMVDQLPDDREKAQALRQLGEVCYALRLRASAMRMLSEALDLETPGPSRAWRDEREETLVTLSRAAIAIDQPDTALGITAQIGHPERRGLVETEVVRWLLKRMQRTRAEEVAYAIGHTAMHEWAMAEVAVGHMRGGDATRGETVLSTLKTETAIAWARGELACDAGRAGNAHAASQLAPLANSNLVDRQLALLAQAFLTAGKDTYALDTALLIEDRVVRTQALCDLALQQPPNAKAVLQAVHSDVIGLSGDERAPLVTALAMAQASVERLETALQTTALLQEDEERDRAQSRVAVALAQHGNESDARLVAESIGDDDERDWTYDELARLAASRGEWPSAFRLAEAIGETTQRDRTTADVLIAWGRSGTADAAQRQISRLASPAEQLRTAIALAVPLVEQREHGAAYELAHRFATPDARSRYEAALAVALAQQGDLVAAQKAALNITRPMEQARALAGIAEAAADADVAHWALGAALRIAAAMGRSEVLRCFDWSATTLARLGGAELLLAVASAIDDIDGWWG